MARSLFLSIISVIITVCSNAISLAATDEVAITGLNPAGIVETVPLPEPEPEPEPVLQEMPAAPVAGSNNAIYAQTYAAPAPVAPVIENYTVTVQVANTKQYNELAYNLSYSDIYKFRNMVYGHNASNLLLSLSYKNIGDVISVTEGGVTTNYQIVWKREMLKVSAKELQDTMTGQVYAMDDISRALDTYHLALETCSGYGNTPYRWVLFANRI